MDGRRRSGILIETALNPMLAEVTTQRARETQTITRHLEISLNELINRQQVRLGELSEMQERGDTSQPLAANIKQTEDRIDELNARLENRRAELERERECMIGDIQHIARAWVLPHPERQTPHIAAMVADPEIERIAVQFAIKHEEAQGRVVESVEKDNRGFDLISRKPHPEDPKTAIDVRFIEVKGRADTGDIALTFVGGGVSPGEPEIVGVILHSPGLTPPPSVRRYQNIEEMRSDLYMIGSGKSALMRKLERANRMLLLLLGGLAVAAVLTMVVVRFSAMKSRLGEENRRRELREIQISRMRLRDEGWFTNYWSRLSRAAAVRKDTDVLEQASALLAGLDARPLTVLHGVTAASAAFASDGRALISGLGGAPAILLDTNGGRTDLMVRGEGPVCWASDGVALQLVAVTNGLILREAVTGNVRRQLPLAGSNPSLPASDPALDITPDGTVIAATLHNRLLVWRAASGEKLGGVEMDASALALSPDGSMVGLGGADGTARVYAVPGLDLVSVLPALRGNPILCLAFTRDRVVPYGSGGRTNSWLLATGDKGAGIVIWDVNRRLPRSFCRGSTWNVAAIAFSPDGLTLASAGRNQPRLWDVVTGQPLLQLSETSSGESLALAFDDTGRRLICGGEPGGGQATVAVWQLEPDRGIQALRGLVSSVRRVWFSPDARLLAALSDDWHLAIWETASSHLLFVFETPVGVLADNAGGSFDASAERFAFATGREGCLFDLGIGAVRQRWNLKDGFSDQVQFNGEGRLLLLRRERALQRRGYIWRLYQMGGEQSPELLHEQAETNWVTEELALAPGGERFLVWNGGPNGTQRVIRAYDALSGLELWKAATERAEGNSRVVVDPTGQSFAYNAYATSGRFRVVRFAGFQEIRTVEGCEALSASGHQFANGGWLSLDRTGLRHGIPLTTDWLRSGDTCTFSRDGRLLSWGTLEGVVLVADIRTLTQRLAPFRK